jgi:hypothetical protein
VASVFPSSFKERILFSISQSFLMVLGMMSFNLILHNEFSLNNIAFGFPLLFITAFLIDWFIINKITVKIVSHYKKQFLFPISKVTGMVVCMSCIALLIEIGFMSDFANVYCAAITKNYPIALLLQIIVAGPLARRVLEIYKSSARD